MMTAVLEYRLPRTLYAHVPRTNSYPVVSAFRTRTSHLNEQTARLLATLASSYGYIALPSALCSYGVYVMYRLLSQEKRAGVSALVYRICSERMDVLSLRCKHALAFSSSIQVHMLLLQNPHTRVPYKMSHIRCRQMRLALFLLRRLSLL